LENKACLLSSAYFACFEFYHCFKTYEEVYVELYESYTKQTYRNRCEILGANGKQILTVPVKAPNHTLMKDVLIDNTASWQKQHIRSICSAYGSAPYFIYYDYLIFPVLEKPYKYLIDLNLELTDLMLGFMGSKKEIKKSERFEKSPENIVDLRNTFSPKKASGFTYPPYSQVFDEKFGFTSGLSVLDGLFNLGPDLKDYQIIPPKKFGE
jgi:hypothetical protein